MANFIHFKVNIAISVERLANKPMCIHQGSLEKQNRIYTEELILRKRSWDYADWKVQELQGESASWRPRRADSGIIAWTWKPTTRKASDSTVTKNSRLKIQEEFIFPFESESRKKINIPVWSSQTEKKCFPLVEGWAFLS